MSIDSNIIRRRTWLLLGLLLCAALTVTLMPRRSMAQAEGKKAAAAPADAEEKKDANEAPPADEADQKDTPQQKSYLAWILKSSGVIGALILVLSIYFVSTVTRMFWEMRIEVAAPPKLIEQCEGLLEQHDFKGIYSLVRDDDSFFARIMTTGITELPNGLAEARDAMERVGEAITAEMEKKISPLAVLGTLGPMIGLLGTLMGMISSFSVIAMSDVQMKASEVAAGISQALVLTFEGVSLSVPAIYFFALFRNRVVYISTTVMLTGDQFLRHFSHAGRAKAAASAPGGKPTT